MSEWVCIWYATAKDIIPQYRFTCIHEFPGIRYPMLPIWIFEKWQDSTMSAMLAFEAFLLSALFFLAGHQKKYVAIGIWTLIVISLFSDVPAYLKADNFLYPVYTVPGTYSPASPP